MEYDYCLFCGKKAFGYKRKAAIGSEREQLVIEENPCCTCEESAFSMTCRCKDKMRYDCSVRGIFHKEI